MAHSVEGVITAVRRAGNLLLRTAKLVVDVSRS